MIITTNKYSDWSGFSDTLIAFESDLTWDRDAPEIKHESDMGGFNIPKIFRQQVNYEVLDIEGIDIYESLKDFLSQGKDEYHIISEFLLHRENAVKHNLGKYMKESGKMNFQPGQVVFLEDSSPVLKLEMVKL
jgi:hypothetical protein